MEIDEKERQECLKMMRDPGSWGLWPILPMKKLGEHGPNMFGFMLATGKPKLYLRNFLDLQDIGIQTAKEADEKIRAKEYASFEAMIDDGWIVD